MIKLTNILQEIQFEKPIFVGQIIKVKGEVTSYVGKIIGIYPKQKKENDEIQIKWESLGITTHDRKTVERWLYKTGKLK